MKKPNYILLTLISVTAIFTLFIRIPLPSKGYFNFGDIAVVFGGLVMAHTTKGKNKYYLAALAGGLGSAVADIIGGFALFAIPTFIAKGLEGLFAGISYNRPPFVHYTLLILGGLSIILVYFIAEAYVLDLGFELAVEELIPNTIQAAGGLVGGRLAFEAYKRITE